MLSNYDFDYEKYEELKALLENDNNESIILFKIDCYRILENLVYINDELFTKKILNYEHFNIRYYNFEEILSEAIKENYNIAKILIDSFIENSIKILKNEKKVEKTDANLINLVLNIIIKNNNTTLLKDIVKNINKAYQFNINSKDMKGKYPIFTALEYDNNEILDFLLTIGANINTKNGNGLSLLSLAIIKNNLDAVKSLIKHNANVNENDVNMNHPFFVLLNNNFNIDIYNCLIENKADCNCIDNNGISLLNTLIFKNDIEAIISLVNLNNDIKVDIKKKDKTGNCPIVNAIIENNYDIVVILVSYGIKQNINLKDIYDENGNNILALSYQKNYLKIFKYLIRYFDISQNDLSGKKIINKALINEDNETLKVLINRGVNINNFFLESNSKSIIDFAIEKGKINLINLLLEDNDYLSLNKINDNTIIPINKIIISKSFNNQTKKDIILKFKEKGCNLNLVDKDGFTPLNTAIFANNFYITKILIQNGSSINKCNRFSNFSPLDYAISVNNNEIVDYILKIKSSVFYNINPKSLNKPFKNDNIKLVKLLFDKKLIEVDEKYNFCGHYGETLLHLAVRNESLKIMKYLIDIGSDPKIKNNEGHDSFDLASNNNNKFRIYNLLNQSEYITNAY